MQHILALVAITLCFLSSAYAAQIVPANVITPGGFGPGHAPPPGCKVIWDNFNGQAIECDVQIPAGTVAIAGWSGYMLDFEALGFDKPVYMSTEVWHDGGTPHLLDQPHWGPGVWTLGPTFYPAGDGHNCKPGDRFFARFWCVGSPWGTPPLCAAQLIGHFRVAQ